MSSYRLIQRRTVLTRGAAALVFIIGLSTIFGAKAENNYFSLKKIFPSGKCSPVIPNYELMVAAFAGGEITRYKIHDDQGDVVEVISAFISEDRNQWAMVGSKTETKVIFCLYASGVGEGSVDNRRLAAE